MSGAASRTDGLLALDGRAWAQLLRALRHHAGLPGPVADALGLPSGELSGGSGRRALCEALAAADGLVEALLEDTALPASVHHVLGAAAEAGDGSEEQADDPAAARDEAERIDQRARSLRRELDEERRRREGAEVRAASAEAHAEALASERNGALARVRAIEEELARSGEVVERTAARAERRSSSRVQGLERELADERRAHAALRREHERVVGELAAARAEVGRLRFRSTVADGDRDVTPEGRPLVLPRGLEEGTTNAARWLAEHAHLLVVDGYNATLQLRPDRPLEDQRRWLVERLRLLVPRQVARPVVIFDGDRSAGRMSETGGVEVRFSPEGVIADDEIVFTVAATEEPVLVVTDDAELGARVRAEGGNVIGVVHLPGILDG